jgi:TonB family protein
MLASLVAFLAAAAPPAPLPPRQAWVVDYAETFCSASREYGAPDAPLALAFRPSPDGKLLQVFVVRNGGSIPAEHVPVTVGFAERTVKTTALVYSAPKSRRQLVLTSLGPEAIPDIARTGTISLRGARGIDWTFAVPGMGKVMAALETCNANLRAHWNIDETAAAAIKTPARPLASLASWVSWTDYPAQALREEDVGKARVVLLIDEQGKVGDCLLVETSGNASLDAMTCIALKQRGKFQPALDASGKPLRSVYSQAISWRISL